MSATSIVAVVMVMVVGTVIINRQHATTMHGQQEVTLSHKHVLLKKELSEALRQLHDMFLSVTCSSVLTRGAAVDAPSSWEGVKTSAAADITFLHSHSAHQHTCVTTTARSHYKSPHVLTPFLVLADKHPQIEA